MLLSSFVPSVPPPPLVTDDDESPVIVILNRRAVCYIRRYDLASPPTLSMGMRRWFVIFRFKHTLSPPHPVAGGDVAKKFVV